MPYVCKNRCQFDGLRNEVGFISKPCYDKGAKYCPECCYFCKNKFLACLCCGRRYRTTSKKNKSKGRAK